MFDENGQWEGVGTIEGQGVHETVDQRVLVGCLSFRR